MDLMDTESFCSNSSSDINLPKDYSLSSSASDMTVRSDTTEANNNTISKSMRLNFGVERLLSKCDKKFDKNHILDEMLISRSLIDKKLYAPCATDSEMLLNLSASNVHSQTEIGSNQLGINLLHQQLSHINNGLANQSFVLKPFPIRFGRNHNGFAHQPPSYFQSNLRKVTMTSNMSTAAPYANLSPFHHSIMRLPAINQLSPNSSVAQFYNNQKISKPSVGETKAQQSSNANGSSNVKRKRSWSRAVFSNLQRKGLERQFEFQKYITKPDRKKLAARLGLKDAQVKVWFQNRRMKWRHTTRGTTIPSKIINSSENAELNEEDEHFTSSSSDNEDGDIDVVTDN